MFLTEIGKCDFLTEMYYYKNNKSRSLCQANTNKKEFQRNLGLFCGAYGTRNRLAALLAKNPAPLRDRQNGSPTKTYSQQQCNHNKDCRTETQVLGILLAKEEQNRDSQQNYGKSIRQDKTQQCKHTHKRIIYQAAINNLLKYKVPLESSYTS